MTTTCQLFTVEVDGTLMLLTSAYKTWFRNTWIHLRLQNVWCIGIIDCWRRIAFKLRKLKTMSIRGKAHNHWPIHKLRISNNINVINISHYLTAFLLVHDILQIKIEDDIFSLTKWNQIFHGAFKFFLFEIHVLFHVSKRSDNPNWIKFSLTFLSCSFKIVEVKFHSQSIEL